MSLGLEKVTLGKRLLAIAYDLLIVFFITFIITLIAQQLIIQLELITLEKVQISKEGDMVNVIPSDSLVASFLKSQWIIISLFYFGHYWTKNGQTLGMKVWKMVVVNKDASPLTWLQAIRRYVFSLFGLGLIWAIFDKDNLALQDKISQSMLRKTTQK